MAENGVDGEWQEDNHRPEAMEGAGWDKEVVRTEDGEAEGGDGGEGGSEGGKVGIG